MTKQEFHSLKPGMFVKQKLMNQWWFGEVVGFNSNHSQVKIRWCDYDHETWEGRLRIELVQQQP